MYAHKQKGAVALFMVLVLLFMMSGWGILLLRFNVMESVTAASEARSVEALQAADAGLEYAVGWLSVNPWCDGQTPPTPPVMDPEPSATDNYEYAVSLAMDEPASHKGSGMIQITATSNGPQDTNISGSASRWVYQSRYLEYFKNGAPPPLVINGCLSGVTGTPNLYPAEGSEALHTSQDTSCIDFGNFDVDRVVGDGYAVDAANPGAFDDETSAWDYVFSVAKSDIKTLSDQQATAGLDNDTTPPRTFYWVDSSNEGSFISGNNWSGGDVGSVTNPVILAFDEEVGCPKINGGDTIYGIVYYETASACTTNGWGAATVYGSVVHEGDIEQHTANSEIYHPSRSGSDCFGWPIKSVSWIPGTWADF